MAGYGARAAASDASGWLHPHFIVRERPYHTHVNPCIHVPIIVVMQMPNPGQPTIASGATGDAVRRLQRALRRTPILGLVVDGVFGPTTEAAVRDFQQSAKSRGRWRRRASDLGGTAGWPSDARA